MLKPFLPLVFCTAACAAMPASAQQNRQGPPPAPTGWSINAGAGALLSPHYLGDDAYVVSAVPYIRVTHSDRFVASVQEGAKYNAVNTESLRAGPLMRLEFGRNEDGGGPFRVIGTKTSDLTGLGDIDTSVSFGGFAEIDLGKITLSAKASQAISGHDGLTGDISAAYKSMLTGYGPPIIYSFGPNINFGDSKYMSAQFGVNAAQSRASGLPFYDTDGGIVSYGVSATAVMPLTQKTSITLISSYSRLSGDAADAPLVMQRGSRDQFFMGLVTAYKFR